MKHRSPMSVLVSCLALFAWCGLFLGCADSSTDGGTDEPVVDVGHFSAQNYPRVDGSTSTHPLQVIVACRILGVSYYWDAWFDGTQRVRPLTTDTAKQDEAAFIGTINHNGTNGSYVNLITDSADTILVARGPSADELALADSIGVTVEAKPVALDAFVFILNVDNSVDSLTVQQIQDIYTGQTTNWQQVGGTDVAINPYQRDANSGSQELMETLVMTGLQMVNAPNMILMGMMGPINRISSDPDGIGYTVYFFKQFMAPSDRLKFCGVNGVMPDSASISSGDYVYTTDVFVAIRTDLERSSTAYSLREWLLTRAGQGVVAESGYVPVAE